MEAILGDEVTQDRPVIRASRWRLVAALLVAALGVVVAFVGASVANVIAYFVVLIGGTGLLAWHRYRDSKASWDVNYLPSKAWRRVAVLAAVLIVVACALNAFAWATEVSKL